VEVFHLSSPLIPYCTANGSFYLLASSLSVSSWPITNPAMKYFNVVILRLDRESRRNWILRSSRSMTCFFFVIAAVIILSLSGLTGQSRTYENAGFPDQGRGMTNTRSSSVCLPVYYTDNRDHRMTIRRKVTSVISLTAPSISPVRPPNFLLQNCIHTLHKKYIVMSRTA
jgi:hypothetical protein